ncbi:hypothetical protein N656DRAFT_78416 [Canariomyces notabilis]|uniref:Uncharacterized protein n=1 Tax=Canariomyces notabilis TaxID=2074819 RepID=A0AAN6YT59_9PEZI|nr:hypothetical protein N656DRAFT_78416 [Canariomyces arenarius]
MTLTLVLPPPLTPPTRPSFTAYTASPTLTSSAHTFTTASTSDADCWLPNSSSLI